MDKRGGHIELKRKRIESDANEQFLALDMIWNLNLPCRKGGL
ncbi:hypothetical protein HMPREF1986_01534 [Oribacterium sp. oral taxon 078 str. F0263]|nr:hypothetical protein HMPREF1986_01534 [Oribacterium sp. oral taxon 078 str. F0263]